MQALGRRQGVHLLSYTEVRACLGHKTLFQTKKKIGKKWPTVVIPRKRTKVAGSP